jgi:hypothetical protein
MIGEVIVTLDLDGYHLESDHYLRQASAITAALHDLQPWV